MDSFRFMASMAADSAFESFSSTQERARELAAASAASLQTAGADGFTSLTSGVACMRAKAATASGSMASLDLSRLEAGTLVGSCSLFAQTPQLQAQQLGAAGAGTSGGSGRPNDPKASDEDSESGGEDGGRGAPISFFSRFGMQSSRPESQQLLAGSSTGRVAVVSNGGVATGSSSSGFGGASSFGLPASFSSFPSSFTALNGGSMTNLFGPAVPKEPLTFSEKVRRPTLRPFLMPCSCFCCT
jgi:hypothetical protein